MKILSQAKKFGSKIGSSVMVGAVAFSVAHPALADTAAEITTAVTDAKANYGVVVAGVIGVAAIGFGLSFITGALRK
eukprot:m.268542 g.268542  ORF g.268542 m.268542 type:complete len:77 (-) comp79141_c0_seq1:142-372(-)